MGGVDVADQRISYYHPSKVVCQRNWIPIFIQLLSIVRNNAYIVHRNRMGENALSHKAFSMEIVCWCMSRAQEECTNRLKRTTISSPVSELTGLSSAIIKRRAKRKSSSLAIDELSTRFPSRFITSIELHSRTNVKRGTCVMCSAEYMDRKRDGEKLKFDSEVKRTHLHCAFCSLTSTDKSHAFLCKTHFEAFHKK